MIALIPAMLTGLFCALFAFVANAVLSITGMWAGIGLAFISGFCGSMFAHYVLRKGGK